MKSWWVRASGLFVAGVLAACSEGDPAGPARDPELPELTVNAANGWAFVSLTGSEARVVSVASAAESSGWDIAFYGTSVMLNGGAAGPGGVAGYCVCTNAALTDMQVKELKAQTQTASFESVEAAQAPRADTMWKSDVLSPAITGWYSYNPVTHAVSAAPTQSFYIRTSDGQAFVKLHVVKLENATRTSAGRVTFEYALQATKGAPMGAVRSATIDVPATGRLPFDLNTGTATSTDWDIAFEGFSIRVNGGVSGAGQAGAVPVATSFGEIRDASEPPATVYKADEYGGVFDARKWYRYNVTGTDHQIWPTYDVYLLKRGSTVHKIQLINYYNDRGESRHITFRYGKVAG